MRLATYAERYSSCKESIEWFEAPDMESMWDDLRQCHHTEAAFGSLMVSAVVVMSVIPDGPITGFFGQLETPEFYQYFCEKLLEKSSRK